MNNNEVNQIDALALFSTFLGCLNYSENLKQTSNDELKEVINEQTYTIVSEIRKTQMMLIENQEEMMRRINDGFRKNKKAELEIT